MKVIAVKLPESISGNRGMDGDSTAGKGALLYAPNWQTWHSVSAPRISS